MLHVNAAAVDYDGLRQLKTPPATPTHVPIPHFRVVDLLKNTLVALIEKEYEWNLDTGKDTAYQMPYVITANLVVVSVATASTEGVRMKAVGTGAKTRVVVPAGIGAKVYPPTGGKFASVTSTNEAIAVAKQSTKGFIQTGAKTFALI